MDGATFILGAACVSGALAGWMFSRRKRWGLGQSGVGARQDVGKRVRMLLAHGFPRAFPLVDIGLSVPIVHRAIIQLQRFMSMKGCAVTGERVLGSLVLVGLMVFTVVDTFLLRSLASSLSVTVACCASVIFWIRSSFDRYEAAVRASIPDSIRAMRACFQAGFSLEQTLDYLANHSQPEMARSYKNALRRLKLGCSASEVLTLLRAEACAPEFRFVTVALDVQHQTGGSLATVLESAERAARDQFELERSLRVQTAQAQLSARVVSIMPFVVLGVFSLITEGFLDVFFESAAGFCLFAVALGMELAGIALCRKVLRVKGVTS